MNHRLTAAAGLAGPVLFIGLTLAQVPFADGYLLSRDFISHLAIGSHGWIQSLNFIVSGLLIVVFALGLRQIVTDGPGHRWGPWWVLTSGVALVGAGLFTIDPGPSYPPGFEATHTIHGTLHSVLGPVLFLGLTMTAATFSRRFGRAFGVAVAVTVPLALTVSSVLTALDWTGAWDNAPAGLFESIAAYAGMGWIFALAAHEWRRPPRTPSA